MGKGSEGSSKSDLAETTQESRNVGARTKTNHPSVDVTVGPTIMNAYE